jgi:hypothetical protein
MGVKLGDPCDTANVCADMRGRGGVWYTRCLVWIEGGRVFARTVTASFDVDLVDELAEFGESVKDRIASFPGLLEWRFVADVGSGRAVSFSTFSDEAAFVASRSEIDSILSELGRFLVETPTEILGNVVVSV